VANRKHTYTHAAWCAACDAYGEAHVRQRMRWEHRPWRGLVGSTPELLSDRAVAMRRDALREGYVSARALTRAMRSASGQARLTRERAAFQAFVRAESMSRRATSGAAAPPR
jgi:hypothetical protein